MAQNSRKIQYLVAFAVSLTSVTSGVSFSWTIPVLPKFHNNETHLHITDDEISWMVGMSAPGIITGSLAARFISDKSGRRITLLGSAFPFATGSVVAVCAVNAWMLYVARYLWGCGMGMVGTVSSIYIAEISDKDIRGILSVGNRFMFSLGCLLVMTIGSFLSITTMSYLLLVLSVGYFLACCWIPETPYYLLKEGKVDAARKELLKLSGCKDAKGFEERLSLMRSDVKKEMSRSSSVKELFLGRQYRKALVISIGLRIAQSMSGTIAIMQYLGLIMQESKSGMKISTALITFGVIRFVVGIMSSALVDKVGRRPLLIFSFLGASICLVIVGAYFYIQEVIGIDDESSSPYRYITFVGIVSFSVISTLGFNTLVFVIQAEIFPLNVKSVAMTVFNISAGFLGFISVKGYQLIKNISGLYAVFLCFGTASFIGAIFSYLVVPETKGKSLREIQIELQGNIYDDGDKVESNNVDETEIIELNKKEMTKV